MRFGREAVFGGTTVVLHHHPTAPTLKDGEFSNVPETRANYQPHIYNFSSRQERRGAAREVTRSLHLYHPTSTIAKSKPSFDFSIQNVMRKS